MTEGPAVITINRTVMPRLIRNRAFMSLPEMAHIQATIAGIKKGRGCSSCRRRRKMISLYPNICTNMHNMLVSGGACRLHEIFRGHYGSAKPVTFKFNHGGTTYSFNEEGLI